MGFIGLMVSFIAAIFMLVGLIPFLGWLNWFTTLPAAITGAVLSGITLIRRPRSLSRRRADYQPGGVFRRHRQAQPGIWLSLATAI